MKTVAQLVAALQSREVSARELLDQALRRIDAFDAKVNAVIVRDVEGARSAADAADAALARGERRPLLGVPMTIKEAINVAGLPTTWGLPGTEAIPVREDAVVVQRLKAAGAVLIGKTNVPPHLADWQTDNPVHGTTNNPWDLSRTPGGSSGGSAAALAAGYVPLELGTDMGGSLRIPAAFCGVHAHKPTHNLLPMRGVAPPGAPCLRSGPSVDFAVVGPMARSAGDLSTALDVLAGPDEVQATAYRLALPPARHDRLGDFRVLVLDHHPHVALGSEVAQSLQAFVERLGRSGCRVTTTHPSLPGLGDLAETYGTLFMAFLGANIPADEYGRLQQAAAGLPPDARGLDAAQLRGMVLSHRDWIQADRRRAATAERWRAVFQDVDVVVTPVWPTPAFPHDHSDMRTRTLKVDGRDQPYMAQSAWISLATLTGLPATAMPIGLGRSGLPVGVQAIGPMWEDRTPLAFAALVEREFGGFVAPAGFEG